MEFVKFEKHGFVGVLTVDRQQALNALNSQVIEELDRALDEISFDEIRCLIVTAPGESLCCGRGHWQMASMTGNRPALWAQGK